MSLTADSGTLAVVKSETQSNVWIAPAGDASRARPVTYLQEGRLEGVPYPSSAIGNGACDAVTSVAPPLAGTDALRLDTPTEQIVAIPGSKAALDSSRRSHRSAAR